MEAPPFDLIEKKTKENPLNVLKNSIETQLNFEQIEYNLVLSILEKENQLIIEAKPKNVIQIFDYMGLFTLDDIIKLNNFFKLYSNIKEVRDLIIEGKSKDKLRISSIDDKKGLILTLNFFSGYEEKQIDLILSKRKIDKEDVLQLLSDKIKFLESENKLIKEKYDKLNNNYLQLKNEFEEEKKLKDKYEISLEEHIKNYNKLKNEFEDEKKLKDKYEISLEEHIKNYNKLKNEFEEVKNWKIKYENEMKELIKKKIIKETFKQIDSKIIKTKEELKLIDDRIKNNDEILKKKTINYKLLYRGTRDGDKAQTFHSKCDNKKPTLSIIKTKKGMRFGGYTEQTWNDNNGKGIWKKDDKSFCFSIELNKIYNIIKGRDAIYCYSGYMCYFRIFGLYDNAFSKDNYADVKIWSSFEGQEKDHELTNEDNDYFSLAEVEVFEISFD